MMRRVILVMFLAAWVVPTASPSRTAPRALPGWSTYDRYCLACHGGDGDGKGPAAPYTWGRPANFARGSFAWRTTPDGSDATDDDLRTSVRFGAPGTSMPAFDGLLAPAEIDQLVEVVRAFGKPAAPAAAVVLAPAPPVDAARGAALWMTHGCAACHGDAGAGDGPSGVRPFDLTRLPLRRPRATDDPAARRRAAALSIATGLSGTPMPSYADSATADEIWWLADRVVAINAKAKRTGIALDAAEIEADRAAPIAMATWPGPAGDADAVFGVQPLPAQGPPPASLAPAEASLAARQCARCHAKQYGEWQGSLHHGADSPGLRAQIDYGLADPIACRRCHAPLAEQADPTLRADGASCAGCHVRRWERHGPPNLASSLLRDPSYPLTTLPIYERADFCMPCHQLTPRDALAGKPLLDTYKEWLEGPYMRRGIQCQHCHMPNREHRFLGIHDRETFRQGIALRADARAKDGVVTAVAELTNIGAGHYLPTTPTPAAWLRLELLDARGQVIGRAEQRIGRDLAFDGEFRERADTRIPPGEHVTLARAWTTRDAVTARVTVEVHPDDYYEGLYATMLAGKLEPASRALFVQALARGRASHYIAEQRDLSLH